MRTWSWEIALSLEVPCRGGDPARKRYLILRLYSGQWIVPLQIEQSSGSPTKDGTVVDCLMKQEEDEIFLDVGILHNHHSLNG